MAGTPRRHGPARRVAESLALILLTIVAGWLLTGLVLWGYVEIWLTLTR